MILGWATRPLLASFEVPPAVEVLKGTVRTVLAPRPEEIAYPVFGEAYVTRLLDRDEFRTLCDRHKTRSEILRGLE
jgi:hypothetical protein